MALVDRERQILNGVNIRHSAAKETTFDSKARGQVLDLQQHFISAFDRLNLTLIATHQNHRFGIIFAGHLAQLRNGSQQRLGVRVLRVFEYLLNRALFDLLTAEHDDHAVGHLGNNSHIVRDEHHCSSSFAFQTIHQCQNFGLNGHIQSRCRLVRDQQTGFAGQCHCDHDTLAHTAGQFVGILGQTALRLWDPNLHHQFQRFGRRLSLGQSFVQAQSFGQLTLDSEHRVQSCHRFLEDHANLVATD